MSEALIPVPFQGDTLTLIDHYGEPYAAMRPIVESIGLDWKSQHQKLTNGASRWGCGVITTVAEDGKNREMLCMPVRKLAGWLAGISAAKVKPEARDNLIAYQNECDDALWQYWTQGRAERTEAPAASGKGVEYLTGPRTVDPGDQFLALSPVAQVANQCAGIVHWLIRESATYNEAARAAMLHAAHASAQHAADLLAAMESEASHV